MLLLIYYALPSVDFREFQTHARGLFVPGPTEGGNSDRSLADSERFKLHTHYSVEMGNNGNGMTFKRQQLKILHWK